MHELSIVASIVDSVTESLAPYPGAQVKEVRLRVGALSSIVQESLDFCYGIGTDGTALQGSRLVVDILPVIIHCKPCDRDVTLDGVQSFRCPLCGEPSMDLRQGREMDIDSIEIEDEAEVKA